MRILRNRRLRRYVAGSVAVMWLFTVFACAVDSDAIAMEPAHTAQLASLADSGATHHPDGDITDDPCCQAQSNVVVSFSAVKLPQAMWLAVLAPLAVLAVFTLSFLSRGASAAPDRNNGRRRFEFIAHFLEAQAPPL